MSKELTGRAPGVMFEMQGSYRPIEALVYDRFIAPAVFDMLDRVIAHYPNMLPEKGQMIDIGCGGGAVDVELARRHRSLEITGVDLSPGQIKRAAKRAAARTATNAGFRVGDAAALPFDDDIFDAALSVASIKHWPRPEAGLAEAVRVLRPGGALLVIEADRGCELHDAQEFVDRWRIPGPLKLFALAYFRTWVAGGSFELEEAKTFLQNLPGLTDGRAEKIPGAPAWAIAAHKK